MLRTAVTPVRNPPRDRCDWQNCEQPAAHRVIQRDDRTEEETGVEMFYCDEHAALVLTMADEAERRHRWRQGGSATP